jgi:DMSO reductase anchor subunit
MDILHPIRQKTWGVAAVINFWLGGMSAAAYIFFGIAAVFGEGPGRADMHFLLLIFILMGIGFLLIALHAGRPDRAFCALVRFRSSWMSRETVAAIIFFASASLNHIHPHQILVWLSSISALFFVLSQSMMPYKSLGIGGWRVLAVPFIFTLSSLISGYGLVLLSAPLTMGVQSDCTRITAIALIALNAVIWFGYVRLSKVSPPESISILRKWSNLILVMAVSMFLPFFLLLICTYRIYWGDADHSFFQICDFYVGMAVIAGAFLQKYFVIAQAGWWRPLRLGIDSHV